MRQSVVTLVVILATIPANAQTPKHAPTGGKAGKTAGFTPARTADGHPDLQGVWTNDTLTPLERPKGFEDKAFFASTEQQAFERAVREHLRELQGEENLKTSGDVGFDAAERGALWANRRTALIIDPPSGKIPPRLPAAQHRFEALIGRHTEHPADGPEDFSDHERCRTWNSPPMVPPPSNAQIQIVQTPDHVVLLLEMYSEARIVQLDGRPHPGPEIRRLKGDSRGRWEGDTLVVETTNFVAKGSYSLTDPLNGLDESLRVIERFTLSDADTIVYRFTVDDGTVFTRSWTAEQPLTRSKKPMFEFACHEGNYSLKNSLLGGRAVERKKVADPQ